MSITLDQVTKHYAGVPVVNDVSLDIGEGEFFVLLGPSGSGKSTLLRAVAGLRASTTAGSRCTGATSHTSPRASAESASYSRTTRCFAT